MRQIYADCKVDLFGQLIPVFDVGSIVEDHQCVVFTPLAPLKNKNVGEDLSLVVSAAPQTVLGIESPGASIGE